MINTEKQFNESIEHFKNMIKGYQESQHNIDTYNKIKDELKWTKDLKKGNIKVGKYLYDDNILFKNLREYNILTREQAYLKWEELQSNTNEKDKLTKAFGIRARFLWFKSSGISSVSSQLMDQVYFDITQLKEKANNEREYANEYLKALNDTDKQELINILKDKQDHKEGLKNRYVNMYGSSFSNIWSLTNIVFGKKIADKYNSEIYEQEANIETFSKMKNVNNFIAEILELKNTKDLVDTFSEWSQEKTKLYDIEGIETEISTMEKIDIYNAIKNTKTRQDYFDNYGEETIRNLVLSLTEQQQNVGDIMMENVQDYERLNAISIDFYQKDLPKVENYWPATSEHKTDIDLFNTYSGVPSNSVSAMKERVLGKVKPEPNNAYSKFSRHIEQTSYMVNLAKRYKQLDSLFLSNELRKMITSKFGNSIYKSFETQIGDLAFAKRNEFLGDYSKFISKATGNWIVAKIASPTVFVKQILSIGNYAEEVNTVSFIKNFTAGISHPQDTIAYMKQNASFLEERYKNGFNEAIKRSMEASKLSKLQTNFTNISTFMTRIGDIGSIIFGGYGQVKSLIEGGMTETEAFKKFQQDTLRSQQSSLRSSISSFQKSSNPLTRLFFAFQNTSLQYMRKINDTVIIDLLHR